MTSARGIGLLLPSDRAVLPLPVHRRFAHCCFIDVVRRGSSANGCLFRSPAPAPAQEFKRTEESPATEKKVHNIGFKQRGFIHEYDFY